MATPAPQPGVPLTIRADLLQPSVLDKIELAYRRFGETQFKRIEMAVTGSTAEALIPGEAVQPPFVEYYFILYVRGAQLPETYPVENPEEQPLKISFQAIEQSQKELIILSPDKDEKLSAEDLTISFSLAQFDSLLDFKNVAIFIDGSDITGTALRYGDLVVVRPENAGLSLAPGSHTATVQVRDSSLARPEIYTWNFTIEGAAEEPSFAAKPVSPWRYNSSVKLETRQENISGRSTPYNRATLAAGGAYKQFQINGFLYLTNEEKSYRQPQHRYYIVGESPWLKLGYGDSYPMFPDLIMSGKRVRGFFGNLTLDKFSLDIASGTISRAVNGSAYGPIPDSMLAAAQSGDPTATFRLLDSSAGTRTWEKLYPGTYTRDLFIIRPSFGRRDDSHWGFTYAKSKDDISSIHYGVRPRENVVFGSDFLLSFDRHRIEILSQAAFSATNNDITNGSITDADIDSMFSDESASGRRDIRQIRDIVSKIITMNENLIPWRNMKHSPTLSYETGLALNYFNNYLHMVYLRHGGAYESFGQPFLRKDVAGYSISDRLRLFSSQLLLSGGLERLSDNTALDKPATTTQTTSNFSVSYFPLINFPNITVAYLHASNTNGLPHTDSLYSIDERMNRVMLQIGKEFTYYARHNAQLSVSTSVRDDNTPRNLDTRTTTVGLSATSTFTIPLKTMFSLSVNSSRFVSVAQTSTDLSYVTVYANGQYRMMADKLLLDGSISPTFGDIQRILLGAGALYYITEYFSIQTQLNIYLNKKLFYYSDVKNDLIWTLTLRADV